MAAATDGLARVFGMPRCLKADEPGNYCPGCGHGVTMRMVAEVIDELGVRESTIGVIGVGCSDHAMRCFDFDMQKALHGRASAQATGIKRVLPDRVVFSYQGDGDLAGIGAGEMLHTALRGELITIVFMNNAGFGMTGGQMGPTTLPGQKTTTTPGGRDTRHAGWPVKVAELLAPLPGVAYVARVSLDSAPNVLKAKRALLTAFQTQLAGAGFSLVEILSSCPTQWRMSPQQSIQWLKDNMLPYYPLGTFKDATKGGAR